jgi:hypothetical protein
MSYYPYGVGYGYGRRNRYGPNLFLPIIQSDYKLGGLFNEYAELNDVAARNNYIYNQNMSQNCHDCRRSNGNQTVIVAPSPRFYTQNNFYPSNPYLVSPYSENRYLFM